MGTLTANLGLDKPTVGADADQWGTLLNQSLDTLDLSVQFGALTKSVAGGVNVTLTANEAAKQVIILTGLLTANIAVIVPNSPVRRYVIRNNTTGAFTVTVRRAVGTGVLVPQGGTRLVYNDGSEVFFEDVQFAQTAASATTATNVNGGTASVTTLTASGAAQLNGGITTTTLTTSGNVALNGATTTIGDAGTDTALLNAQLSAGGGVGLDGQVLNSRGANLSPQWRDNIVSLAPQSATGTQVNFVGIPAWAKQVTLMARAISTTGNSPPIVQIGSGAIQTTGYVGAATNLNPGTSGVAATSITVGAGLANAVAAASVVTFTMVITNMGSNVWVFSGVGTIDGINSVSASSVTLAGALDRVRLTTINGTDTFDAGSVSVIYE